MEAVQSSESSLSLTPKMSHTNSNTTTASGSSGESIVLRVSLKNPSDESGSTSTSDSGCDGDDEESSVEITRALLTSNYSSSSKRNPLWGTYSESSADEFYDEEEKFQGILKGSFPLREGRQFFDWSTTSNTLELDKKAREEVGRFKHPQLCGIQGRRGSGRKYRKKPPPLSPTVTTATELSEKISDFVQKGATGGPSQLQLPMLSRSLCHVASKLAQIHSLDCLISHGKRLLPVAAPLLRKTPLTSLGDKSKVDAVLMEHDQQRISSIRKKPSMETCALPICVPLSTLHSQGNEPPPTSSQVLLSKDAPPISGMLMDMTWKSCSGLDSQECNV